MDVQTCARLEKAKAGDEVDCALGKITAVRWPYLAPGDTCGDCPVGRDDCEASRLWQHCITEEIVFRLAAPTAKGE